MLDCARTSCEIPLHRAALGKQDERTRSSLDSSPWFPELLIFTVRDDNDDFAGPQHPPAGPCRRRTRGLSPVQPSRADRRTRHERPFAASCRVSLAALASPLSDSKMKHRVDHCSVSDMATSSSCSSPPLQSCPSPLDAPQRVRARTRRPSTMRSPRSSPAYSGQSSRWPWRARSSRASS